MRKWLVIGLGAVLLILIIVLVIGISNLGPIIKTAVNTYLPSMTQTDVSVANVNVSLFTGEARLNDFVMGNPRGFSDQNALSVNAVTVDVDEKSLAGDTIIIDRIEIQKPVISYELKGKTDNFRAIINNIKTAAGPSKPSEPQAPAPAPEKKGKSLLIRDFAMTGGTVNMSVSVLGQSQSVTSPMPDLHMKNVGGENTTPRQVMMIIFQNIYENITSPQVMARFRDQFKAKGIDFNKLKMEKQKQLEQTTEQLKKKGEELKGLGDQFKGILNPN